MAHIHIIDDDILLTNTLSEFLKSEGYEVSAFYSAEKAQPSVTRETPDVVLLDLNLPGMDGLTFLEKLKKQLPDLAVIMISGYADVSSAVRAMRLGARDYITKPINLEEIQVLIQKAIEGRKKDQQLAHLKAENRQLFGELVGVSEPMKQVSKFIRRVAASSKTSVLIQGETGTGKELVARAIHNNSDRADKPFIEINCSAFQESLLESELFGYEQGAFTDAKKRKRGLFELAHEGSFFLDEVADMNLGLQSKLLKAIEEQTFRRIGGTKEIEIDCRIISASSRNLTGAIAHGKFREDLYYRLNVATVELPPLRERGEDIIVLAHHFLQLYNAELKRSIKGIKPDVVAALLNHSWPGNVREIRNIIERAVLFEENDYLSLDSVGLSSLPKTTESKSAAATTDLAAEMPASENLSLIEAEKSLIKKALKKSDGNQSQAAKLLEVSRETLRYRIKKLKLSVK